MSKNNFVKEKENPVRSILKAFSWRIIATITTFIISFLVFNQYTNNSVDESIENAGLIASVEFFAKIIFYYFHERMWTNIRWGKYWRKTYWSKRAWKRLYNKMHEENDLN